MKRWLLLGIALFCIGLPMAVRAQTWDQFVRTVNTATKGAQGDVVVVVTEPVDAYKRNSRPLVSPPGVQLIIEGGRFTTMQVQSGHIELRDVTVTCDARETPALHIPPAGMQPIDLTLIISAGTTIQGLGHEGEAIGTWKKYAGNTNITLINYGTIRSAQAMGILVRIQGQTSRTANLRLYNFGEIQGETSAVFLAAETVSGSGDVWLHNEGTLDSRLETAATIRIKTNRGHATGSVWNAPEGVIRSEFSTGLCMSAEEATDSCNTHLINLGTIAGRQQAVSYLVSAGSPAPAALYAGGTFGVQARNVPIGVSFRQALLAKEVAMTKEAHLPVAEAWLAGLPLGQLPGELSLQSHLLAYRIGETTRMLHQKTYIGGALPDEAPTEAPPAWADPAEIAPTQIPYAK